MQSFFKSMTVPYVVLGRTDLLQLQELLDRDFPLGASHVSVRAWGWQHKEIIAASLDALLSHPKLPRVVAAIEIKADSWNQALDTTKSVRIEVKKTSAEYQVSALDESWFLAALSTYDNFFGARRGEPSKLAASSSVLRWVAFCAGFLAYYASRLAREWAVPGQGLKELLLLVSALVLLLSAIWLLPRRRPLLAPKDEGPKFGRRLTPRRMLVISIIGIVLATAVLAAAIVTAVVNWNNV